MLVIYINSIRWKQPQNFLQGFSNNCVYQKAHIVETFQKRPCCHGNRRKRPILVILLFCTGSKISKTVQLPGFKFGQAFSLGLENGMNQQNSKKIYLVPVSNIFKMAEIFQQIKEKKS